MKYDMHSVSLVQDIGSALIEPAFIKYRANPELHTRNMSELLSCVRNFFAEIGLPATATLGDLDEYFRTMGRNAAFNAPGTTPGNGTLWLFLLARGLRPPVIVESGVHHGSSLFTLRHAVLTAKIFAFDVTFGNLLTRLDGVDYREHDWGIDDVRATGPSDFCFFDDHINNCMRIRQSFDRGFKHVIVDDSPDLGEIHHFRYPSVPTISMIKNDKWHDGDTAEWNWNGRRLRYTFRIADTFGVTELIEGAHRFPSIKSWTGMDDAYHWYVRLKS
jgi:hypothetical protein